MIVRPALLAVIFVTAQAGLKAQPPTAFDPGQWIYPKAQADYRAGGRALGGQATNPRGHEVFRGTWRTHDKYSDVVKFYEKQSGLSLPIGNRAQGHNENFIVEDSELRPVSLRIMTKRLGDNTQVTVVISRADQEAWTHITMFAYREIIPRPQ